MEWPRGAFLDRRNIPWVHQALCFYEKGANGEAESPLPARDEQPQTLCTLAAYKEASAKLWEGRKQWRSLVGEKKK